MIKNDINFAFIFSINELCYSYNEIQVINIFISDKYSREIQLFKDTPTIVKLISHKSYMDFTSSVRVSC